MKKVLAVVFAALLMLVALGSPASAKSGSSNRVIEVTAPALLPTPCGQVQRTSPPVINDKRIKDGDNPLVVSRTNLNNRLTWTVSVLPEARYSRYVLTDVSNPVAARTEVKTLSWTFDVRPRPC